MIRTHISQRYPGNQPQAVALRDKLARACEDFVGSGRADSKFVTELTSGNDQKFWASISEALIAEQLHDRVFLPRPQVGVGPDFLLSDGIRRVWIEVVCPEHGRVPDSWLNAETNHCIDFPHTDILLRWTSAIKTKAERLLGNADEGVVGYLNEGIVGVDDAYVIAVNGCRMRSGPFSALFGISQLPFAAEAVLPIGPIQVHIDRETLKTVGTGHQHRPYIMNKNGAVVPTYMFLNPVFAPISAIWAVDLNGASAWGGCEPMVVVHNPIAANPIPRGFLPAESEYVAHKKADQIVFDITTT